MATKTYYPEFTRLLYRLSSLVGSKRQQMINRGNFQTADVTALDALQTALTAATQAFPSYIEPA